MGSCPAGDGMPRGAQRILNSTRRCTQMTGVSYSSLARTFLRALNVSTMCSQCFLLFSPCVLNVFYCFLRLCACVCLHVCYIFSKCVLAMFSFCVLARKRLENMFPFCVLGVFLMENV